MNSLQGLINASGIQHQLRPPVKPLQGLGHGPVTPRVIAVTSGKGGVGKTILTANIALALAKMKQRVLIIDADLGLGNIDLEFGLTPQFNLNHYFHGDQSLADIMASGPGGVRILPAGSGGQQLTHLTTQQRIRFTDDLDRLHDSFDYVLIDTEAGISENVTYFNAAAQDILVVTTPDPAAITDAYALIKLLATRYHQKHFKLVVNQIQNADEGLDVYQKLTFVSNRCLDIAIDYLGCIPFSTAIRETGRRQKALPDCSGGVNIGSALEALACTLAADTQPRQPKGTVQFFWSSSFPIREANHDENPTL
jgi:flagellar biosynthesis protein FlhG